MSTGLASPVLPSSMSFTWWFDIKPPTHDKIRLDFECLCYHIFGGVWVFGCWTATRRLLGAFGYHCNNRLLEMLLAPRRSLGLALLLYSLLRTRLRKSGEVRRDICCSCTSLPVFHILVQDTIHSSSPSDRYPFYTDRKLYSWTSIGKIRRTRLSKNSANRTRDGGAVSEIWPAFLGLDFQVLWRFWPSAQQQKILYDRKGTEKIKPKHPFVLRPG